MHVDDHLNRKETLNSMIAVKSPIECRDIFREALKATWYEFVQRTTIHGLRYIIDKQGNKFTRLGKLIEFIFGSRIQFLVAVHCG